MRLADNVNDGDDLKLDDGLYEFDGRIRAWIEDGVLYLPAKIAHPMAIMVSQTRMRGVEYPAGVLNLFIRARDLIPLRPDLAALVRAAAVKFECQV
jgi:hypothetical protein